MKKVFYLLLLIPGIMLGYCNNISKTDSIESGEKKVKTVLGPNYDASGFYRFFMGDHWRDLWITEIELPVLDLYNYKGGLTPIKKGGSFQTKSLRFIGGDGKQYKFRSIDKDPTQTLPEHLQNSIIADILKDQTSISNPSASIIAPYMLDAVGVLNAHPTMYVLPDDPKLGEYQDEFGGIAGTIEENPKSNKNGQGGFGEYDKILTGFDIYKKVKKSNNEIVDPYAFLKARLMDILFGDRDRHGDQWKWAGTKKNGIRYWIPIPRDRDFAFCLYDGLFPSLASRFDPSSIGFGTAYRSMKNQTYIGRHLDRRFLSRLTKTEWDSVVVYVRDVLTDEVITKAVQNMPKEMYKIKGEYLIRNLIKRRNKLVEVGEEFYNLLFKVVDIYGSDKPELYEIERINNDLVRVTCREINKDDKTLSSPFYKRDFLSRETEEIRIHMLDGKNKAVVRGKVDESILIRVIGGSDKDIMIDSSEVSGYFLDFTPVPKAENLTKFYDSGKKTVFIEASGTDIYTEKLKKQKSKIEKYEPTLEDRYSFLYLDPTLQYNTHDGVIFGLNPIYRKHGFRADPYMYSLSFSALYATDLDDYDFLFKGSFNNIFNKSTTELDVKVTGIEVIDFFGFGNESEFDLDLFDDDYYRIDQEYININLKQSFKLYEKLTIKTGFSYEFSNIDQKDSTETKRNRRLFKLIENLYGTGEENSYLGIGTNLIFDSRDKTFYPRSGHYLELDATYYPTIFNNRNDFSVINADLRGYYSAQTITDMTLALRIGGKKIFGKYPFFKAANLGGAKNVRGFTRERFSGDAYLFGQAELRFFLINMNFLLPGKIGLSALTETGRVFYESEQSKKWHASYGGGVWITVLDDTIGLSLTIARSPERTNYFFLAGFSF